MKARTSRIPELDGIRGLAIGMVLFYHYFALSIPVRLGSMLSYAFVAARLGWSGVDLFFVLSGFLIGGILLDARGSSNYFRVFYTRRFFRIVPIYSVLLVFAFGLVCLIRMGLAARLAWMVRDQLPWAAYLVFLQNCWMAVRTTWGISFLSVTWSLAVEEQFYLTLPLLIYILSPRRLVAFVSAGILAAPALRIVLHAFWPRHNFAWVVLMPCRADALLLGVAGAIVMRDPRARAYLKNHRNVLRFTLAIFACGFVFLTLRYPDPYGFDLLTMFGLTWIALFYLCILLYSLTFGESPISRCLRFGWLRWLGSIAYGAYLLHDFVRSVFFGLILSRPPVISSLQTFVVTIAALAATLILWQVSWVYFEGPLVQKGHGIRYRLEGSPVTTSVASASAQGN